MKDRAQIEDDSARAGGRIGRIPVRNLWWLMWYASDVFRMAGMADIALEASPNDLPDLVARLLQRAVSLRLRRQLGFAYRAHDAVLNRVRGRIDIMNTDRQQLLTRGKVRCRFEQLSIDTPRNRLVRSALEVVSGMITQKALRQACWTLAAEMRAMGVVGRQPTLAQADADRFGRHDREDQFMVACAKLVFDLALLNEETGTNKLVQPERDERWVRKLFEKAIAGFYAVTLRPQGWRIRRGRKLKWQVGDASSGIARILPQMNTDMVLDSKTAQKRIVIDTKFAAIVRKGRFRETLDSGYIYQMYAYLFSQIGSGDALAERASGLLLYPAIDEMLDESVVIQGHLIRFATVDLAESAPAIADQLASLL